MKEFIIGIIIGVIAFTFSVIAIQFIASELKPEVNKSYNVPVPSGYSEYFLNEEEGVYYRVR